MSRVSFSSFRSKHWSHSFWHGIVSTRRRRLMSHMSLITMSLTKNLFLHVYLLAWSSITEIQDSRRRSYSGSVAKMVEERRTWYCLSLFLFLNTNHSQDLNLVITVSWTHPLFLSHVRCTWYYFYTYKSLKVRNDYSSQISANLINSQDIGSNFGVIKGYGMLDGDLIMYWIYLEQV